MNTAEARFEELYDLLDDLCEGSLTSQRAERLDGLLQSDAAMRREYRCYLEVHAGLGLIAGGRGSETLPPFASTVAETGPAVSSVERPNVVETGHVGQVANLPRT